MKAVISYISVIKFVIAKIWNMAVNYFSILVLRHSI